MTPLPKRRLSRRRQGKRRAALKFPLGTLIKCANCGKMRLPHRACPHCGYYDGKVIFVKKVKKTKK
ncbi:MAG: hypothetical protein ACD_36C00174G0002 [uncultured bacterium]|uniref:Large ribosomal subunit protein bL32 n=1 Tax=Candidatus Gottesmanbacteria bacterium RIFCSPLOWO2_01_FULL_43_11b TaxID=1798392 RepID=A0A1F6AFZ6_9BACT|nr:MAG: hypothetical protein ACD_36C00174G0002 [uncultured bacterium]OGG23670.1 MAG: 50S ribosomal protein L32 [Candidatus Gottesmanbacteria bacterium RIFCSPLOWO2_01_FULL_43_11b]